MAHPHPQSLGTLMRGLCRLPFLLLSLAFGHADDLRLAEGGWLRGTVLATTESGIHFQPEWRELPLSLDYADIQVLLRAPPGPDLREEHVVVHLQNGDRATGTLVSADRENLVLKTLWGQTLAAETSALARIDFLAAGEVVADGLRRDGSVPTPPFFHPRSANLAKDVGGLQVLAGGANFFWSGHRGGLPPRFVVETEIHTPSPEFRYSLVLLATSVGSYRDGDGSVQVDVLNGAWQIRRPTLGVKNVKPIVSGKLRDGDRALQRIHLYADTQAGEFAVYLNGVLLHKWKHVALDLDREQFQVIRSSNNDSPITLLRQQIRRWEGSAEAHESLPAEKGADRVLRKDGTSHPGKWLGVQQQNLRFFDDNLQKEILLPLEDVRLVERPRRTPAAPPPGTLRLFAGAAGDVFHLRPDDSVPALRFPTSDSWRTPPTPPVAFLRAILAGNEPPPGEPGPRDAVHMFNGDSFHGLVEEQVGGRTRIRVPWSSAPLVLPTRHIQHTVFSGTAPPSPPAKGTILADVFLTNGNQFRCRIIAVSHDHIQVQTSWGQRLVLATPYVRAMDLLPADSILLEGTGPLEAWTWFPDITSGDFPAQPGPLGLLIPGRSFLSRKLPRVPERMLVEFSLYPDSPHYNYLVKILTDENNLAGGMTFMFSRNRIHYSLQHSRNSHPQSWHLTPGDRSQSFTSPLDVKILADFRSGTCRLHLNGEVAHEWRVEPGHLGALRKNPWIRFSKQYSSGSLFLSRFRVRALAAGAVATPGASETPPRGLWSLQLNNGDQISGRLLGLKGEGLELETDGGIRLDVPLKGLLRLVTDPERQALPRINNQDMHLVANGGLDHLTLRLESLDASMLVGASEFCPEPLRIPRSAWQSLRLNAHARLRGTEGPPLTENQIQAIP